MINLTIFVTVIMYLFMLAAMGDVAALDALLRSHPGMLVRGTGQDGDLLVAAAAKGELAGDRAELAADCGDGQEIVQIVNREVAASQP